MTPVNTYAQATRIADEHTNNSGITHYVIRKANGDLGVSTFEELAFDLCGDGQILYTGRWRN